MAQGELRTEHNTHHHLRVSEEQDLDALSWLNDDLKKRHNWALLSCLEYERGSHVNAQQFSADGLLEETPVRHLINVFAAIEGPFALGGEQHSALHEQEDTLLKQLGLRHSRKTVSVIRSCTNSQSAGKSASKSPSAFRLKQ